MWRWQAGRSDGLGPTQRPRQLHQRYVIVKRVQVELFVQCQRLNLVRESIGLKSQKIVCPNVYQPATGPQIPEARNSYTYTYLPFKTMESALHSSDHFIYARLLSLRSGTSCNEPALSRFSGCEVTKLKVLAKKFSSYIIIQ